MGGLIGLQTNINVDSDNILEFGIGPNSTPKITSWDERILLI